MGNQMKRKKGNPGPPKINTLMSNKIQQQSIRNNSQPPFELPIIVFLI